MLRRLITTRSLLVLTCVGALAAALVSAPVAGAQTVADPGALVGSWNRALTRPDIERTASARVEPQGWSAPLLGPQTLVIANGSFTVFDKTGFSVGQTTRIDSTGAFDVLAYIRPDKGAFCPQDVSQNASYTWQLDGADLVLTPIADLCADRDAVLTGRWTLAPKTRTMLARATSSKDTKTGFSWAERLSEGGKPVGKDSGSCTFVGKGSKRATCKATLHLTDGTISLRGSVELSKALRLAIVGGTGAYEGAGGSATSKDAGKRKSQIVLRFA